MSTLLILSMAPKGDMPLGPALLYLFGVIAALIIVAVQDYRRNKPKATAEQIQERRKAEHFTNILIRNTRK